MAKKWKTYPWTEERPLDDEDEEIDVVGDTAGGPQSWGPASPTAAATAPSPPPPHVTAPDRVPLLYNGKCNHLKYLCIGIEIVQLIIIVRLH